MTEISSCNPSGNRISFSSRSLLLVIVKITDPSKFILKKVKPGSIVLIHMPEKGIREWNFEAMELTLKGLKEKGYDIVTFSELYGLSQ